jgi:hypothetical protein
MRMAGRPKQPRTAAMNSEPQWQLLQRWLPISFRIAYHASLKVVPGGANLQSQTSSAVCHGQYSSFYIQRIEIASINAAPDSFLANAVDLHP